MKQQQFKKRILRVVPAVKQVLDEQRGANSVTELANTFQVSRNSIQNAFKQQVGEGIRQYKLKSRMEVAKQMLQEGNEVKVVAITLNYSHTRNFSTAFKKYYGVAPTQLPTCANEEHVVLSKTI